MEVGNKEKSWKIDEGREMEEGDEEDGRGDKHKKEEERMQG